MKNVILASTSTVHGSGFLEYLYDELIASFDGIDHVLFIPYARPSGLSYEDYTSKAKLAFKKININLTGIHEQQNPENAIKSAKGIFIGGGNTFVLTKTLYDNNLIPVLKEVVETGTPYLGTSAGSNICGQTIGTTNDMPIVYPPSFIGLGLIPYNINSHYLDPDPGSTHMGETRETRINEFHVFNEIPVIGLREGSWIKLKGSEIKLQGNKTARVFAPGIPAFEISSGSQIEKSINNILKAG
ncbi:MAG: dipeptidase PepE [Flavobacteriaceae bacterium]|nr:dipeptidase PepE [Bacteroidia bacterium]NNK69614.1 dipeptidase PepE [Flavobacteriaceae bacterium]